MANLHKKAFELRPITFIIVAALLLSIFVLFDKWLIKEISGSESRIISEDVRELEAQKLFSEFIHAHSTELATASDEDISKWLAEAFKKYKVEPKEMHEGTEYNICNKDKDEIACSLIIPYGKKPIAEITVLVLKTKAFIALPDNKLLTIELEVKE